MKSVLKLKVMIFLLLLMAAPRVDKEAAVTEAKKDAIQIQ